MQSVLLVGLALAAGAPAPKEAPKKDPSIVGEWDGEKAVSGGKERPVPDGGIRFTFTADGKLMVREGKKERPDAGSYTVDTTRTPAEIDITPPAGKVTGMMTGIFRVDGDTLTICLAGGKDGGRPTRFESPEGAPTMLLTFKRVKKD